MTEQEQAQQLARWLEQPAGTPPPEGIDPDVIESVYAMRPDLAPAPRLTADDILADLMGPVSLGGGGEPDEAPEVVMPPTPVAPAPAGWRSANRVAGLAVLMATAATLLLVVLPAGDQAPGVANEAAMEEVAAARQSKPDPIASVDDEAAEAPQQVAAGPTPAEPGIAELGAGSAANSAPTTTADPTGDAVADAVADAELADDAYEFKQDQGYGSAPPIPEVAEALEEQQDQWTEGDAVADLYDEDAVAQEELSSAPQMAAPAMDEPDYYGGKGSGDKREQRKNKRAESEAEAPAAAADDYGYGQPTSRSAAVPSDLGDQWRGQTDGTTEAAIDEALRNARAERSLGNIDKAVAHLLPHVTAPALAGQYVATVAVQYQLEAGDVRGALTTAQQGLALTSANSPYRAMLLALYGNALDQAGDPAGAEAAWREAAGLNAAR